jgi:hypothetical protein
VEVSGRIRAGLQPGDLAEIARQQARMWHAAREGAGIKPILAQVVLPPVNDVLDLHSTRMAADLKSLPPLVLALLVACAGLSVGVMAYGTGLGGHRRPVLTFSLVTIIGAALWITIDLTVPAPADEGERRATAGNQLRAGDPIDTKGVAMIEHHLDPARSILFLRRRARCRRRISRSWPARSIPSSKRTAACRA